MTIDRMKLSAQTVRDNIAILEEVKEPDDAGYELQLEHEKFVLECIEKQIPKKVIEQTKEDREFIDFICPVCKTTLQQKIKVPRRYLKNTIYKYRFCLHCGQALDWGDTE